MKENRMKYNIEPLNNDDYTEEIKNLNLVFEFDKQAQEELRQFEEACTVAYIRFFLNRKKQKAELAFHKEIKKYRKVFNHNIQDITKHKKFELIYDLLGKVTEYQTN